MGDTGGGYNVGWTRPGEWLEYTVHVPLAGFYAMDARVASSGAGGTFHVELDGVDATGPIAVPDTGGWNNWSTLSPTTGFFLNAGAHAMRIRMDSAGALGWVTELNWVRFTAVDNEPPSIPSDLAATAVSESAIELTWAPSTDDSGVAGYRMDVSTDPSFGSILNAYNNKDVGNGTRTTIAGLTAETTYHARLRAFDGAGHTSTNSAAASATTLPSGGCVTATYPDSRWHNRVFAAQTTVFTAVADVTPFASNVNAAVGVSSGPQSSWGGLAANVLFFTDGTIQARDGDGYPPGVVSYTAGSTYRVRMVIDLTTHTYSAHVAAPGAAEQVIGTGLRFRTGQDSVTSLDHWTVTSDSGSLTACNFNVPVSPADVTLQQGMNGYGGVADTRISYYDPNVVFGSDGRLLIGGGGAETVKSLVRFDLSSIPAGAVLSSATLSLYNHAHNGDVNGGSVSVHPISKPWVEMQATWNVSAAGVPWSTSGMQAGADYSTALDATIAIDETIGVWRTFDVTAIVQQWLSGALANHGFLIRSGTRGVKPYFYSSNHAADPALRPKLVIELAPD
ncbi:MAG TPA: DNRLRE domain-containing protein [Thermoanaerobaculia bacterium]